MAGIIGIHFDAPPVPVLYRNLSFGASLEEATSSVRFCTVGGVSSARGSLRASNSLRSLWDCSSNTAEGRCLRYVEEAIVTLKGRDDACHVHG